MTLSRNFHNPFSVYTVAFIKMTTKFFMVLRQPNFRQPILQSYIELLTHLVSKLVGAESKFRSSLRSILLAT